MGWRSGEMILTS